MRWKLSPAIPSAETLRIYACQLAADQGLADHSPGTGKKQRSTVLKHHDSSSKTETDTQQKPLTASGTAATPTQNTPDKPTNSANSSPKNAKNAFFQPGNAAIWIQVLLIAIQAIASAIALYSIGEIISLVFFSDGKILLQTWITAGAMWIAVAAVGSFLLGIAQRSSMHSESLRMRQGLLHQAFRLGPARFNGAETGSILSTLTDSVERVTAYRQGYIGQLFGAVLTPFLTLAVIAFFIDWLSAVILFLCIPLVPLAIGGFQQLFRQDSNTSRQMREQLAGQFLEAIQGLPTLVGINAAKTTGEKLANTGEANRVALMRLLARNQLLLFVMEAVFSLFLVTLAIVLAYLRFQAGALSIGGSFALILLTTQLTTPINEVGGFFYIGLGGRAGMRAIRDFMQRESNWQKQHCQLAANPGELAENFISLDGINFSYDGKTKVLRNLDLQVPAGTTTVLLGKSGGGKSTLLSIIGGDLVPAEGDIRIGGVELCADTQDEIRAKSAVVRQQTWLFSGTLAENLRLAKPNASDAELYDALAKVSLAAWARSLPQQLDTDLGERGARVSGGQAQRISIARAILSNRELLIFDEPTSQVDLASEAIIEQVLMQLAAEKTVILATHRLALANLGTQYLVQNESATAISSGPHTQLSTPATADKAASVTQAEEN